MAHQADGSGGVMGRVLNILRWRLADGAMERASDSRFSTNCRESPHLSIEMVETMGLRKSPSYFSCFPQIYNFRRVRYVVQ